MKKWIKYIAVVCSFFMMVVLFFPYSGSNMVRASEGGTVSGGNVAVVSEEDANGMVMLADEWKLTIKYNLDGGSWSQADFEDIINGISGDNFSFSIPEEPVKENCTFSGWSCSVSEATNDSSNLDGKSEWVTGQSYAVNGNDYNNATITFTAQWTTKSVTVRYVADGGSFNDLSTEKTETITSTDDATDFSINIISDVPEQEGYNFAGWKCGGNDSIYQSGIETTFSWTDYVGGEIVFTAQWIWNEEKITKSGTYSLNASKEYQLETGTWTVNDDNSSYSGEIKFYVPSDGSYTFNSN